jgi:hypothetical protein
MTPDQTAFFKEQGYLKLEGFHPQRRTAVVRQRVVDELRRLRGLAGARGLPGSLQGLPLFQQITRLSALVKVPGLHDALVTPALIDRVARIAGRTPSVQVAQLLLSPPSQGPWTLQGLNWHVDSAPQPGRPLPGIQAFFLIDDVAPHGGATLALAGSHRVGAGAGPQSPAASLREILRNPLDLERKLRELDVTVLEMSGRAGDVFLMDMRVMHSPSVNSTRNTRMMATCRCLLDASRPA